MKTASENQILAAVYELHDEAAATVSEIQHSRVGRRVHSSYRSDDHAGAQSFGYKDGGNSMIFWKEGGIFWDDLWSRLHGSAFYFIPGFGSLLVGGPIFRSILDALETGLSGGTSSSPGGNFRDIELRGDNSEQYDLAIKRGHYLVIVEIDSGDTSSAGAIITATSPLFRSAYPAGVLRETVSPIRRIESGASRFSFSLAAFEPGQ